jgi:hypothetical protein
MCTYVLLSYGEIRQHYEPTQVGIMQLCDT